MTVYVVLYTSMKGEQQICMICEDEQDAIDFCRGHQCYSYDSWVVRESSNARFDTSNSR